MKFQIHQEIGARFKLVVRKVDGRVARETDWFLNLVLDTGLARMAVGTWIDRCCVGTGNSTPVSTQTALDAFLASTTTQQAASTTIQSTTAPYYYSATITWRFGQGVAAGNISEVGLGWGNSNLWNRALIKDANGDPTTITVLSDEYLDVVSEIRVYPAQTLSGSFNLLDKTGALISTHTYTGYPVMRNIAAVFGQLTLSDSTANASYATWLHTNDISNSLTNPDIGGDTALLGSSGPVYTGNSVKYVYSLDLNTANFAHKSFFVQLGNQGLMAYQNASGYKLQISPTITKTSSQIMTYTFELSWGRYTG